MFATNLLLSSDSYKASHWAQYPPKTTHIYSYLESRGGQFSETVFFGLQYLLKEYLAGVVVTCEKIDEAEAFWTAHFGHSGMFHKAGWEHILSKHGGRLPVRIRAVPEGSVVPVKNVLLTIENTDPECFWLTNFLETLLLQVWYPITVATNSREIKKVIHKYLAETGDVGGLPFKLHDFGFRGVSSYETAAIGGAAHLVNFMGTDTVAGIVMLQKYYDAGMCGFSVPASEHSTMTSWGRHREADAYRNLLEAYPVGIVSCVSDSYDIFHAAGEIWGNILREQVLNREGKLVIRPDSGDPVEVNRTLLHLLWERFGGSVNSKGYRVLDPHIGIIQGDGIDLEMVERLLVMAKSEGFSADNLVFGSGGALLQKWNRDTLKFAIKCSMAVIDGLETDVQKDPVTAPGKKSKTGKLKLVQSAHGFSTLSSREQPEAWAKATDALVTVFENGEMKTEHSLERIRERAAIH